MVDGEVSEDPEDDIETSKDDVETGTNTLCYSTVPDTGDQTEINKLVPDLKEDERINMEGGEVTEVPDCDDLENISQSENEAES